MREALHEAAQEVFAELGPGFTESVYHRALERELSERQIPFHSEGTIPIMYKGAPVGRRRPDLFIVPDDSGTVIVELKAGSNSGGPQLMQYLDLTEADMNLGDIRGGAVIRFNEEVEFEFVELGPEPNPDDVGFEVEEIQKLPNGVVIYNVSNGQHSVQLSVNKPTDEIVPDANALSEEQTDLDFEHFLNEAVEHLREELFDDREDST